MEDIFKKLCKIAAGIESDQQKITVKEKEKEKVIEEKKIAKEEEKKDKEIEDQRNGIKKTNFYSKKMNRVVGTRSAISGMAGFRKKGARRKSEADLAKPEEKILTEEEQEKKNIMETIIKELKDRDRDCNNFDPGII